MSYLIVLQHAVLGMKRRCLLRVKLGSEIMATLLRASLFPKMGEAESQDTLLLRHSVRGRFDGLGRGEQSSSKHPHF